MKILHVASHKINVGDGAIHNGMLSVLYDLIAKYKKFDITYFDHVTYDALNLSIPLEALMQANPDHIIIGGGGAIDGHPRKYGTAIPIPFEVLEQIEVPVTFLALGHNLVPTMEMPAENIENLTKLIELCRRRNFGFSVRQDGSMKRLAKLLPADTLDYIVEVPDPGFFVETSTDFRVPTRHENYAIVQLCLDQWELRFGSKEMVDEFLDKIANYVDWLTASGMFVIFASHTHNDVAAFIHFFAKLDPNSRRFMTSFTGFFEPSFASDFFSFYQNAKLVIGMRGHSVICGIGLGVPTIAISTHDKVTSFMNEVGCGEFVLGLNDFEQLAEMTQLLAEHPDLYPDTVLLKDQWRTKLRMFLDSELEKSLAKIEGIANHEMVD